MKTIKKLRISDLNCIMDGAKYWFSILSGASLWVQFCLKCSYVLPPLLEVPSYKPEGFIDNIYIFVPEVDFLL